MFDTFKSYFEVVTQRTLTDNFSIAFQLLEEMLDNGYPMITEQNALTTLIAPPSLVGKMATFVTGKSAVSETIGEGAMSIIPWRKAGVTYVQNEIFFDIVEEIDCIVESNGSVATNDVRGVIRCNCRLSGTPDLTLIFANPTIIEDCSFHPCVRYARYERESVVSFVPPDGPFQLMSYRVVDRNPSAPIFCRPSVAWREGSGKVSFTVGSKPMGSKGAVKNTSGGISSTGPATVSDVGIEEIVLTVSFPKAVKTVDLSSDVGSISIDPKTNVSCENCYSLDLSSVAHMQSLSPLPLPFSPAATDVDHRPLPVEQDARAHRQRVPQRRRARAHRGHQRRAELRRAQHDGVGPRGEGPGAAHGEVQVLQGRENAPAQRKVPGAHLSARSKGAMHRWAAGAAG